MTCSVCGRLSEIYSSLKLLKKYTVRYFRCSNCRFIKAEFPRYWLSEAYSQPLIVSDTGILSRNAAFANITAMLALIYTGKNSRILDYAGGYGIMTRMLRDIGLDCYWDDKYAKNIFSKQFTAGIGSKYNVVTAFEYLEHMNDPIMEILLQIGGISLKTEVNIFTNGVNVHLFSTHKIPSIFMHAISVCSPLYGLTFPFIYKSRTFSDHLSSK